LGFFSHFSCANCRCHFLKEQSNQKSTNQHTMANNNNNPIDFRRRLGLAMMGLAVLFYGFYSAGFCLHSRPGVGSGSGPIEVSLTSTSSTTDGLASGTLPSVVVVPADGSSTLLRQGEKAFLDISGGGADADFDTGAGGGADGAGLNLSVNILPTALDGSITKVDT